MQGPCRHSQATAGGATDHPPSTGCPAISMRASSCRRGLDAYEQLLRHALASGYHICSTYDFWKMQQSGGAGEDEPRRRTLILRHDVDTDAGIARRMWRIDRQLAIHSTYYFRLSTIDVPLMQEMHAHGTVASYHYEEIATIASELRLTTALAILAHLGYIRARFLANLTELRHVTGLPLTDVASHNHYINQALGIPNWLLLQSDGFRRSAGVELETWDTSIVREVTSWHTDAPPPLRWQEDDDPLLAIHRHEPVIYVHVQPRHWHTHMAASLADDVRRWRERIQFEVRARGRG